MPVAAITPDKVKPKTIERGMRPTPEPSHTSLKLPTGPLSPTPSIARAGAGPATRDQPLSTAVQSDVATDRTKPATTFDSARAKSPVAVGAATAAQPRGALSQAVAKAEPGSMVTLGAAPAINLVPLPASDIYAPAPFRTTAVGASAAVALQNGHDAAPGGAPSSLCDIGRSSAPEDVTVKPRPCPVDLRPSLRPGEPIR